MNTVETINKDLRPFAAIEEVEAVKNKTVVRKSQSGFRSPGFSYMIAGARKVGDNLMIELISHIGFWFVQADELFEGYEFINGEPCGMETGSRE